MWLRKIRLLFKVKVVRKGPDERRLVTLLTGKECIAVMYLGEKVIL
jgi:hypothetical protein